MLTRNERNYLLYSMEDLLEEYDYNYSETALNKILDTWCNQKAPLIEAFKKHPNYVEGKFMIAFTLDYEREIDLNVIARFKNWLFDVMYYHSELVKQEIRDMEESHYRNITERMYDVLTWLNTICRHRTLEEQWVEKIKNAFPNIHIHSGEKTTRVVNKICKYIGYDQHPDYNREYAKLADAMSPIIIKRHTVLSLNPLDYLTMSFGNSWASCHTIDKANKRRMPNSYEGQYSSGTMSYMLDGSSMVLYTVSDKYEGNEYWTQPKICRQMFHWGQEKLVQGRLYPQDNDCDDSAYKPYRELVQEIMSIVFDFPNLWTTTKGTVAASRYITSYGTHYMDYEHYDNCRLCRIKDSENENRFIVGSDPICIECGRYHSVEENINCCSRAGYYCADCGEWIPEDEVRWVGDAPYCSECVHECGRCGRYHHDEETYIRSEGIYVCEHCAENYYNYCECCDEYVDCRYTTYIESEERYVCDSCLEDHYEKCECCDEWWPREDFTFDAFDNPICPDCLAEHYSRCDGCGEYFRNDLLKENELGDWVCEDCANTEED